MVRRVVLHVGLMKSGTSYLQSQLFTNKDLLLERGIHVPGQAWPSQVAAARDLVRGGEGMWAKLAGKMNAHEGTSVFSMEFLGPVRPRVIERAMGSLDAKITVVITARDLNRSIPAMWQETIQNGRTWTWAEYLAGIESWRPGHRDESTPRTEAGRTFWRQQNVVRIARTWASHVGLDNVVLVTVPHPGAAPDLLWQRFAGVIGTDPAGMAPVPAANESIGAASTLALRQVNELLDDEGLRFPAGSSLRKGFLAKEVLAARKGDEPSIGLPVTKWVRQHAAHIIETLQELRLPLVGDWEELRPVAVTGTDPGRVAAADVRDAAVSGLAGVLAAQIRAEEAATEAERSAGPPSDDDEAGTAFHEESPDDGDDSDD